MFKTYSRGLNKLCIASNSKKYFSQSYETQVRNHDLAFFQRFKNNENLTISELSNVARIINKLKITDSFVLKRLEDSALPLLKDADETDLRKISQAFVHSQISKDFEVELSNRFKNFAPKVAKGEEVEVNSKMKFGYTMRFYMFLYHQRKYYLSFFRFFGIILK